MSEYIDTEYTYELKCEKCGRLLDLSTSQGAIVWTCPQHGERWREDKLLSANVEKKEGNNDNHII